jgi:hypothetical protein
MVAMRLQLYIDSTFLIKNCFFVDFYNDPDNIKPWRSIKKKGPDHSCRRQLLRESTEARLATTM